MELELIIKTSILTRYVVRVSEQQRGRFLEMKVRWKGGREKVRWTGCEKSSIECLTRRCSKGSLSRRRDDLFPHLKHQNPLMND